MVITAPLWGLLELGFVAAFLFLWAFDPFWRATLGAALRRMASVGFGGVHGIGGVHPLRFLNTVDAAVLRWIRNGKAASERGVVYSFNKLLDSVALLFGVPLAIALGLYELAQYVAHVAPGVITKTIHETVTKPITRVVKSTAAITKTQFNHLVHRVDVLASRVASVARTSAGAIAAPFPRIGRLEKTLKAQSKRLTKVEKLLLSGLGVAVVAKALSRLGLGWLRCNNVKRTGKAVCGMNPALLESLLGSALLLTGAISLRDLVRELEEPTKLVTDGLRALVDEF